VNGHRVAVIGAGWAGLSAALHLAEAGRPVLLIEAASVTGGRARSLQLEDAPLDNGQHILVGACRQVLERMRSVGVDPESALLPLPFGLTLRERAGPGFRLAPHATHPWALAASLYRALRGEPLIHRLAALAGAARMLHHPLAGDLAVSEWLQRNRQPAALIRGLWEPLCLAVMNAPPAGASARIFQTVLRQTLLGNESDARLLIPRLPLGALFPEPAAARLRALGAEVRMGVRVTALEPDGGGFRLRLRTDEPLHATQVILATAPRAASRLLPAVSALEPLRQRLGALGERSICTVYLRYPRPLEELPPLTGLLGQHGQWVLPRRVSGAPRWAAVVISAAEEFPIGSSRERWRQVAREIAESFPGLGLPEQGHVICERHATLDARPGIDALRPGPETGLPGLYLAGDYCAAGLPSTLEAAVQGGLQAARAALAAGS
jgi:hydroxysqualene dehydroxylase